MLDFKKETQLDLLEWVIMGGIDVQNLEQWQISSIRETMKTYADLPADLADATLLETAESRGLSSIISLDKDFSIYKLNNGQFLENLLK